MMLVTPSQQTPPLIKDLPGLHLPQEPFYCGLQEGMTKCDKIQHLCEPRIGFTFLKEEEKEYVTEMEVAHKAYGTYLL